MKEAIIVKQSDVTLHQIRVMYRDGWDMEIYQDGTVMLKR